MSCFDTECVYGLDFIRDVSLSSVTKMRCVQAKEIYVYTTHSRQCISIQREGILSHN